MPPAAKPALKHEPNAKTESGTGNTIRSVQTPAETPRRLPNALAGAEPQRRPVAAQPLSQSSRQNGFNFQPRIPVLQGEAIYHGWLPVDGIISGQLGASGSTLTIKQRPRNGAAESAPELNGEITFKDMLRVNGHIAGRVFSQKGTLIIDASARVNEMSAPESSTVSTRESFLNDPSRGGEFADFLPDTTPYFETWLESLRP